MEVGIPSRVLGVDPDTLATERLIDYGPDGVTERKLASIDECEPFLEDDSPGVTWVDVRGIGGSWGGAMRPLTPAVASLLKDRDEAVRVAAAEALGRINPEADIAIPALSRALTEGVLSAGIAAENWGLAEILRYRLAGDINRIASEIDMK